MEEIISLTNDRLSVSITNYGGRILQWLVDGVDIVLGFDSIEQYKAASEPYHSALIGRYANRIANAQFEWSDTVYQLDQNHGKHILHGGSKAFHNSIWTITDRSDKHVEMQLISPDGDQGFPGELNTIAKYELSGDRLNLSVSATTTKSSPVSITHHPYFNLSGLGSTNLDSHTFQIHASEILSTNSEGIPNGNKVGVGYTGFDFTMWKTLNKGMQESHTQIELLGGIDHTYITPLRNRLQLQAEAKSSDTNVHMRVYSNQPGIQFYTANHFDNNDRGKKGRQHSHRGAFCFEPQQWPDSPNQATFPNSILHPGEQFLMEMAYEFPLS